MPDPDKNLLGGKYDYINNDKVISKFVVGEKCIINEVEMKIHAISPKFVVLMPIDNGLFKKPE